MTALAAVCGAVVGLGITVVVMGLRGVELPRLRWPTIRARWEHRTRRLAVAVVAGVLVGAANQWLAKTPWGSLVASRSR